MGSIYAKQMKKIDLKLVATSVVDDFNNIHNSKSGINIKLNSNGSFCKNSPDFS